MKKREPLNLSLNNSLRAFKKWVVWLLVLVGVILLIPIGYHVNGTGFTGKTLWDWMQLLIIPVALTLVVILFNYSDKANERTISKDNQRESAFNSYLT